MASSSSQGFDEDAQQRSEWVFEPAVVPEVPEVPVLPDLPEDFHGSPPPQPYEVFMEVHRCNVEHPDLQVVCSIKPSDFTTSTSPWWDLRVRYLQEHLKDNYLFEEQMVFVLVDLNLWGEGTAQTQLVGTSDWLDCLRPDGAARLVPYTKTPGLADDIITFFFKVFVLGHPVPTLTLLESRRAEFVRSRDALADIIPLRTPAPDHNPETMAVDNDEVVCVNSSAATSSSSTSSAATNYYEP